MDPGVLAHLERGEVEPERRQLPAHVGELAVRHPRQPVADQRLLDHVELSIEGRGIGIAAAPRCRLAGEGGPRPAQPFGHDAQPLPVGFIGEAAPQVAHGLREFLGIPGQLAPERAIDPLRRDPGGHRLHQSQGDGFVAAEEVLGLEAGRLEHHLRGHPRVPVPVRPDP